MEYKIINGAVSYGANTILECINFEILNNDKIAIVGRNGAGKTTLLKAIIDNELLETGTDDVDLKIIKIGNPSIGYLEQQTFNNLDITLIEEILKNYENIKLIENKIKKLEKKINDNGSLEEVTLYSELLDKYKLIGGYTYKKEYEVALQKFGFKESDKYKKLEEFSGGERTKIAFLRLILSKPDILILDEPTNHLDINGIEWLENYLKSYPKSVIVVSHDRMFLDKFVSKVYEIEYGALTKYTGNYTQFEKQKKMNYEKNLKDYEYQQKEIKRLKNIADRFRYKPSKAKMAMSKLKKIEQMKIIDKPNKFDTKTFTTNLKINDNSSNNVLSVRNLEFGYDKPIGKVSFELYKGQKLAIIGGNGKGKSTLIKTLIGEIKKLSGTFSYGFNVKWEYFSQNLEFINEENSVLEEYREVFPSDNDLQIRKILGTFDFTNEDVFKKVKDLSGGEKVRLSLCKILKKFPNLLILDEPTNHLDLLSKEKLEDIFKSYKGTILFVSHDRYFINKLADSLLIFEDNNIKYFNGTYEEYIKERDKDKEEVKTTKNIKCANQVKEKTKSNNNLIKKLEKEIEKIELEIKNIENEMLKEEVYTDYKKINELQIKLEDLNNLLEEKMKLWEEENNKLC